MLSDILRVIGVALVFFSLQLIQQTSAQIVIMGELSFYYVVNPGGTYEGLLRLRNTSEETASARIYLNDIVFEGNQATYHEPDTSTHSNAAWFQLSTSEVTLEGEEVLELPFIIAIPNNTNPNGSYWSMLMMENIVNAAPEDSEEGLRIIANTRYGVSIVTTFEQGEPPQLVFSNPSMAQGEQDAVIFSVDIANSGERLVQPLTYLELYSEAGAQVGRFEGRVRRVFPGAFVVQSFNLEQLEPGTYTAIVVADAGADAIFGARYTLNITAP